MEARVGILGSKALDEIQAWTKTDSDIFSSQAQNIIMALIASNRALLKQSVKQHAGIMNTDAAQLALLAEIQEFLNVVGHVCQVADHDDLRHSVVTKIETWCADKRNVLTRTPIPQ